MLIFFVIDQVFHILRLFTALNVVYDLFFTRKTTISDKNSLIRPYFYSVRTFTRTSDNTTSLNIGGPIYGPSPTSNFWGTVLHQRNGTGASTRLNPALPDSKVVSEISEGQCFVCYLTAFECSFGSTFQ